MSLKQLWTTINEQQMQRDDCFTKSNNASCLHTYFAIAMQNVIIFWSVKIIAKFLVFLVLKAWGALLGLG